MSTDKMYRLLLSSAAIFIPVWTVKLSAERVGVAQCVESLVSFRIPANSNTPIPIADPTSHVTGQ